MQATLQQTPSAQNPEPHSRASAQTAPFGFLPQLPPTQSTPSAQSAFELQVVRHSLLAELQL